MPKIKKFDREKVLSEGAVFFRRNGYNGTSIDDILKATGLSRSSLYDSFSDKHNLYLLSLEFYKKQENNAYHTINGQRLNGYQKIERLFNEVVNHLASNPGDNGCLMVNAAAEMSKRCEKTSQVVCNNKESVQELFSEWLDEAQRGDQLKLSHPATDYSPFLFNALCGL